MSGREPLPLAEHAELMRSALDHIARTARKSRTSTRRLRWIEQRAVLAIDGQAYTNDSFDLPKDAGPETHERLKLRIAKLNGDCRELATELASLLKIVRAMDAEDDDIALVDEDEYQAALARADAVLAKTGGAS